jgi:hypothetical protein
MPPGILDLDEELIQVRYPHLTHVEPVAVGNDKHIQQTAVCPSKPAIQMQGLALIIGLNIVQNLEVGNDEKIHPGT